MKQEKKINNLENLRERVVDLSESERQKQETANEIQKTLLGLVHEKNEKAAGYEKAFKRWVEGNLAKKDSRQGIKEMKKKYGSIQPNMKTVEKHKEQYTKQDYKKILEDIKEQHKTSDDIKDDIFASIKRAFNKKITLHEGSDIDKESSLFLLKVTGFFKDKDKKLELSEVIKELPQGESGERGISIDTGGTVSGIKINNVVKKTENNKTHKSLIGSQVIVSEHSDLSPESKKTERPTSSAHMIFYMLNQLGQLPKQNKEQLQRFINFVDIVDSLDYQASGIDYNNNYKTLFGLYRSLKIEDIYKYFENPTHTGFEILSDEFLRKNNVKRRYRKNGQSIIEDITLKKISEQQKERKEKNIHQLREIDRKGQFGKFNNERFMIALGNEVDDGAQVSSYYDCGLLKIFPSGDFYMFSPRLLPKKILDFDTDEHFLTIRNISKENLEKLLEIFYFNPTVSEGLKEKIITYHESLQPKTKQSIGNKEELKERTIDQLKEGDIYEGVVNNVSGKNIFVYLTPTIIGMIKGEIREKELKGGEKIQVKIKNISPGENNKTFISLEKII